MALSFIKVREIENNSKATVHKSGKLGFNSDAQQRYLTGKGQYAKVALGENFEEDGTIYLLIVDSEDEETLSISKAGDYYYINTKSLFDYLKIDYVKQKIIFDISKETIDGMNVLQLNKREWERKR